MQNHKNRWGYRLVTEVEFLVKSNYVLIFKDEFNDEKLRCRINSAKAEIE